MAKKARIIFRLIDKLTQLQYATLLLLWIFLAVFFAAAYCILVTYAPQHGPAQLQSNATIGMVFLDSLYYSITTATTVGYGDIVPQGFSKALASLQSVTALLIWTIFVTKLVSHRQEEAIREVHRLTFEDVFHNVREGFFIIRKDFDRIIEDSTQHGKLTGDHWTDLVIAYRQGQSLLQEIPNFYADDDQHLYTLDRRREALLHETVHRTLHRLDEMLRVLSKCGIDWTAYEENMAELRSLLQVVEDLTPQWQQESPYMAAFEDILHLNRKIQTLLQQTMAGRIS